MEKENIVQKRGERIQTKGAMALIVLVGRCPRLPRQNPEPPGESRNTQQKSRQHHRSLSQAQVAIKGRVKASRIATHLLLTPRRMKDGYCKRRMTDRRQGIPGNDADGSAGKRGAPTFREEGKATGAEREPKTGQQRLIQARETAGRSVIARKGWIKANAGSQEIESQTGNRSSERRAEA